MSDQTVSISLPVSLEAVIVSLRVTKEEHLRKGATLCTYHLVNEDSSIQTLKSPIMGIVRDVIVQENERVQPGACIMNIEKHCDHSVVAFGLCAICGLNLKSNDSPSNEEAGPASVSMLHGVPQVKVSQQEAERLGNIDKQRLLNSRKLALVVDLDQTLIHTSVDPNIERGLPDVYGFTLPGHTCIYHCRLRPHVRDFLTSVSHLYELHIFTMGTKDYAHAVTHILDPEKKLFSYRIISRDEFFVPNSKALRLKSLFPCGDEMVAIIDDREDVWGACPNLVHVKPYIFFAGTSDINAPLTTSSQHPNALSLMRNVTPYEPNNSIKMSKNEPVKLETIPSIIVSNSNGNNVGGKGENGLSEGTGEGMSRVVGGDSESGLSGDSLSESREEKIGRVARGNADHSSSSSDSSSDSSSSDSSEDDSEGEGDSANLIEMAMEVDKTTSSDATLPTLIKAVNPTPSLNNQSPPESNNTKTSPVTKKINDPDDFLLHLASILKRIHNTFYNEYDIWKAQMQETKEHTPLSPDVKEIIPRLRESVLKGTRLLFTGVIPTNMKLERSQEWNTATAFGATVHSSFILGLTSNDPDKVSLATTHVIVGRPDTTKYKQAKKEKLVKFVNPRWFWSCAERWERLDESVFPIEFEEKQEQENEQKESLYSRDHSTIIKKENSSEQNTKESLFKTKGSSTSSVTTSSKNNLKSKAVVSSSTSTEEQLSLFERKFSVSSEELEKMEAEIDAELESEDDNDEAETIGSYIQPVIDEYERQCHSFDAYLGLELTSLPNSKGTRKRKHGDIDGSSDSNSIVEDPESSSDESDDELAKLLGMD